MLTKQVVLWEISHKKSASLRNVNLILRLKTKRQLENITHERIWKNR